MIDEISTITESAPQPITVFVVSWGRPLYLWSCLDALYRLTRSPARIVLIDNFHPDPMVKEVINGFERRGFFTEVISFSTNSFENTCNAYRERLSGIGPLHVYIESDCVIADRPGCWLETMRKCMERHSTLGMLGSLIDPSDFVDAAFALRLTGGDANAAEFLAKLGSPERKFAEDASWGDQSREFFLTRPPCPISNAPGRLMMLRTEVMKEIGFQLDSTIAALLQNRGLESAVSPLVRHRHLSLLNIFDYSEYDAAHRKGFFKL